MELRRVRAVRYVMPLREGGSLPAIVEGDDLGLYVLKFRGAGQGPLALVAELVGGEIGRALGLAVPELVLVEVGSELGRNEPDAEIRELLKRSVGLNLGMDFLPGATMFDPAAGDVAEAGTASLIVWFDGLISNVDRTARNPNLLVWHGQLRPIDHGASLFWQHDWARRDRAMAAGFGAATKAHVLLPWAREIAAVTSAARARLGGGVLDGIVERVPEAWLLPEGRAERGEGETAAMRRAEYVRFLEGRLGRAEVFVEEAQRVRSELV